MPALKAQSLLYAPPTVPEYHYITYSLGVVTCMCLCDCHVTVLVTCICLYDCHVIVLFTCMCLYDCHVTVFWKKLEPTGVGSKKRRCLCEVQTGLITKQ